MEKNWKIGTLPAGLALAAGMLSAPTFGQAQGGPDFGAQTERLLRLQAMQLFGVIRPVAASSTLSLDVAAAEANPKKLVTLALGLKASVVTADANAGPNIDMMVLWPDDQAPSHIIACNEEGATDPAVQRISLFDGSVQTLLSGMIACDPIRRTPWGTLIVGEEVGGTGHLLEIIDPLQVNDALFDRTTHEAEDGPNGSGAENVADRPAVGRLAFEGIGLYPNGVMYYGDENRPLNGTPGGAYFKFIPQSPWTGGDGIVSLDESPLTQGTVQGLRLGKRSGNTDYGQGTNTGLGTWVPVPNASGADLRAEAAALKLTGYYRPEDLEIDLAALEEENVRFCGNNTSNESTDHNWGEAICITDGTLEQSVANSATPEVQFLVIGTPELAMMDNMAYRPGRGTWILMEDGDGPDVGRNNDMWACLDDRADADQLSDGCIRIATLNDLNAEWTGGFFDASGKHFFVSLQHNVTGHGIVLEITGWR